MQAIGRLIGAPPSRTIPAMLLRRNLMAKMNPRGPVRLLLLVAMTAYPALTRPALCATFTPHGDFQFEPKAVATYSFEDPAVAKNVGAILTINNDGWLSRRDLTDADTKTWFSPIALDGKASLRLRPDQNAVFALYDSATFAACINMRISVRFWGKSSGTEPGLVAVFEPEDVSKEMWSWGAVHIQAIRTGRETSDGWVEYTTGTFDGSWGNNPLAALVFSTRHVTENGTFLSIDNGISSSERQSIVGNSAASALVDGVEIVEETGSQISGDTCAMATQQQDCAPDADCLMGHCVDGALVWGAMPQRPEQRLAIATRMAFLLGHLSGDRAAAKRALAAFADVDTLANATSPQQFYPALRDRAIATRDRHTGIGYPSGTSLTYGLASFWSGPLNLCLGLAQNDLDAKMPDVFAVTQAFTGKKTLNIGAKVGDILYQIDGMDPQTWLDTLVANRLVAPPNDPAANPSFLARHLADLLGRYASSLQFSRCTGDGACKLLPLFAVADTVYSFATGKGYTSGSSGLCTGRFLDAVSTPPAASGNDTVASETSAGIRLVEFNGFTPGGTSTNKAATDQWKAPFTAAFVPQASVLVDARYGHGGQYSLGRWLVSQVRDATEPFASFASPPAAADDIDPAWLFEASWDACAAEWFDVDRCAWAGRNSWQLSATAPGASAKIAWLNGDDVSMSDVVPKMLQGRENFKIFGPHPTSGAFGEIAHWSALPPGWDEGSLQILDTRFGATAQAARTGEWASGAGVEPDVLVTQKISDLLAGKDTALEAARAWLVP